MKKSFETSVDDFHKEHEASVRLTESPAAMRERFEKIAIEKHWTNPLYGFERMKHGGYLHNYLEYRWQAFQEGWQFCAKNWEAGNE
jgi:hypothetical protein